MIRLFPFLISFIILNTWLLRVHSQDQPRPTVKEIAIEDLPTEARTTLQLINQGGPFPYQRDGPVFGNFEQVCSPVSGFPIAYCDNAKTVSLHQCQPGGGAAGFPGSNLTKE